jgi:DNA segregation ATPase FtsK/SpoIIIE, S-DNA-T family
LNSERHHSADDPQTVARKHPHAALLRESESARAKLDRAIDAAEHDLGQIESEWSTYEGMLDQEEARFKELRKSINSDVKLSYQATRIGELDEPEVSEIDREKLRQGLERLAEQAEQHCYRARNSWFRRKPVRAAVACVEEGKARIKHARKVGAEPFDEREQIAQELLRATIERARPAIETWIEACDQASPGWDSDAWETWVPATEIPHTIRLGRGAHRTSREGKIEIASAWRLNGGSPLLIWNRGSDVIAQVQSLIMRLVAQFPPGMARFVFVDPLGAGKDVAPFLHLTDYDEGVVGGKVWSESNHIEQRLSELQAHIEMVVQKYLRGQFPDIEAHNAAAGEIAEAYRFLVVFDFPANFSETAARRLISIARNGPACGVYPIVVAAPDRAAPHGFDIGELAEPMSIYSPDETNALRFLLGADNWSPWKIEVERPPALTLTDPGKPQNLFTKVISGIGSKARAATNVEVSEQRLLELLETTLAAGLTEHQPVVDSAPRLDDTGTWWSGDAALGIAAPIGRIGARAVQSLALVGTDTSVHALIAGKTGSGKSTLLHATILNLCLLYSPEELELYLVDFKQGVEFKPYALRSLPHARVVAIESEREFGLSVLRGLEAEIVARGEKFRAAGADDLADYRRLSGETMPRILLVADEFHVLFSDDDALATESARILDRLVRQGRSFGVHTVLASQTISGVHQVGRGTMNQIAVRIALQCSESDSQVIFGEDNPDARMLSRPGEAIYNSMNGMPEGNRRFQVVLLQDEERDRLLEQLRTLAASRGFERRPVIFEGNAQADLRDNTKLEELLDGPSNAAAGSGKLHAWLGEPISLEGPVAVEFERRAGTNLLAVGSDGAVTDATLICAVGALLPQIAAQSGSIELLDFGGLDEPFALASTELADQSGGRMRIGRRRQLGETLTRILEEVKRRIGSPSIPAPPLLLILHRLQSARELDPSELAFDDAGGPGKTLAAILRDGPEFGVHTIAACDSLANVERRLEPSAQREFGLRLVSRMSENDSLQLIDSPAATRLVGAQAIFLDEDRSRQVKLRAYGLPSGEWLASLAERPGWADLSSQADASSVAAGSSEQL